MNQAVLYTKSNGLQKADAAYVLDNYFRLVRWNKDGKDNILDVGCGSGDVTIDILYPFLPVSFGKLTGADLSENMVEFARTHFKMDKVNFIKMDISSKEIPVDLEEEFDHIFSFYCLHWIQDQKQALSNIYSLLKPGGDILLTFLASNPLFSIYERLHSRNQWAKYMANYKDYVSPYQTSEDPERDYEDLLMKIGFSVHLCKVVERDYVYPSLDMAAKAMMAVNPFIKKMPESLRCEYVKAYLEEIRKMNMIERNINNNEEKAHVTYKLFIVYASRQT